MDANEKEKLVSEYKFEIGDDFRTLSSPNSVDLGVVVSHL